MAEHKIGEVVTLPDGRKAEVVEVKKDWCTGCLFNEADEELDCSVFVGLSCTPIHRKDHKNIIYKEIKEK